MIEYTSVLAYQELKAAGKIDTEQQAVRYFLEKHDRLTSAEIAHYTGIPRHHVASRLSDLLKINVVEKHEKRTCEVCGRMCLTWGLTE